MINVYVCNGNRNNGNYNLTFAKARGILDCRLSDGSIWIKQYACQASTSGPDISSANEDAIFVFG